MKSAEIRQKFFDFFESKQHKIVPSAPMVVKNDPTLMFTNAGMNQFKDYFLGNEKSEHPRIADTQKCLRVSGKHNDLEEVGHDTYHHTMFEMLGNWSFGDYFKENAIEWAWELLHTELGISKDQLYATYFGGDDEEKLEPDNEAKDLWKKYLPEEQILPGSKKDNFWEMGDTGPCGPCSEIHVDIRPERERKEISGRELVNKDHPLVIEIWNLVFIQYNRLADRSLKNLPAKHVDTGMGFERLCMVLQDKKSNYDTDVFQPMIQKIAELSNLKYGADEKADIAMRVVADHVRAIAFSIADGQLPSNTGAGYVIRRILRRAVRYAYTYLNQKEAFIFNLIDVLENQMGSFFPELKSQKGLITKVIKEEEDNFLKTLENGIKMINQLIDQARKANSDTIKGHDAFTLYDTFGFPFDLTQLILKENNLKTDFEEFNKALNEQKQRSKKDAKVQTEDWIELKPAEKTVFTGYENLEDEVYIVKYRKVTQKKKELYQLVFDKTPFYAESGGQVGDTGYIEAEGEKVSILDTLKENELSVHIVSKMPANTNLKFKAVVSASKRRDTMKNHSATHLMQHALKEILGNHVEQRGSLVNPDHLRFDFTHFQKLSAEEIIAIEKHVNEQIQSNYSLDERIDIPMQDALEMGAMALFGEKYGEKVRVIKFGDSIELCGGTHVPATGSIGLFKIVSESAIAAGVRRIEAITGPKAVELVQSLNKNVYELSQLLSAKPENLVKTVQKLQEEFKTLGREVEQFKKEKVVGLRKSLVAEATENNGVQIIAKVIDIDSPASAKDLVYEINRNTEKCISIIGARFDQKANIWVMISENLIKEKEINAVDILKQISPEIRGGGGGQPFLATAGGKYPEGLQNAIEKGKKIVLEKL
jgi:alanyl-tRNA synthetase